MNAQRLRQTVLGVLLLVAFGLFWQREGSPERGAETFPAPPGASVKTEVLPPPARPTAGAYAEFDYYVLVLSWSPTHCSSEAGRGRDDDLQCRSGRPYGFVLHGLWPQHERGYPQSCRTDQPRTVSDAVMGEALKLSPSESLVQHEWQKHGTCSGLTQRDYFTAAARAVEAVTIPRVYQSPSLAIATTPDEVRETFRVANRQIPVDGLAATCSRNRLAEVWLCLDKALSPRACSSDVRKRHCGGREVRMPAVRGDWPR